FNPLAGVDVKVPLVDANGWPQGGVRFPDEDHPLGKPTPVSLPPVITTSIDDTCGNHGQFQPFTTAELTVKYGSKEKYLELYGEGLTKLIEQGFLLQEDEVAMLGYASYLWDHAESYIERSRSASSQ
ncbi:MAG: alpha/beta hydrolase domain-containing protein, partial [bacterium]